MIIILLKNKIVNIILVEEVGMLLARILIYWYLSIDPSKDCNVPAPL